MRWERRPEIWGCACMSTAHVFANAATLRLPPKAFTWQVGVDVLSFGGTKNGLASRGRHPLLRPQPGD